MKNTDLLDVKLNAGFFCENPDESYTSTFLYRNQLKCSAVLLDKEEIGPGESGYVQLRMEEEVAVRRGDKFVVRFYSPMETIGPEVLFLSRIRRSRRFSGSDRRTEAQRKKDRPQML